MSHSLTEIFQKMGLTNGRTMKTNPNAEEKDKIVTFNSNFYTY